MIHTGDCLEVMPTLDAESIDAIVTDPPYGLRFMGRDWDHGLPGIPFWQAALRLAKPGAHLLAFGGTRTYHRLACAIEDAGWEVRDCLVWAYASGFPKSLDVSKAIDKAEGAERPVVRERDWHDPMDTPFRTHYGGDGPEGQPVVNVTAPATPEATRWQGWGTALKPAWEPIVLARKPLRGTVAANVQRYGTGALNVDGCRLPVSIEDAADTEARNRYWRESHMKPDTFSSGITERGEVSLTKGRWPANLILTDPIFDGDTPGVVGGGEQESTSVLGAWAPRGAFPIDNPTPTIYGDSGTYSRFFLIPKAGRSDREPVLGDGAGRVVDARLGLAHGGPGEPGKGSKEGYEYRPAVRRNVHPTVKPVDLMRHLVRLVTPPGGIVLDPFLGSGTTALAAEMEGFRWVGIEKEAEYVRIAEARLNGTQRGLGIA